MGKSLSDSIRSAIAGIQKLASDPEALRTKVYDSLADIRASDPDLSQQLEDHYVNRINFLSLKAPKTPLAPPLHHAKPMLSDSDAMAFGRYLRAAEQPMVLMEDVADGVVSPETVEAVQVLYPRLYEEMKAKTVERLMEVKALSYKQRAAVTTAFGINLEPTLDPATASAFNNFFAADLEKKQTDQPGGKGGYTAPKKLSDKSRPTQAQRLKG